MCSKMGGQRASFSNVTVGLPSKVRGSEAEEEWQEVDWQTWSSGDLSVLTDFILVFTPENKNVSAKPMGQLVDAKQTGRQDEDRTLVVTTSDVMNKMIRITFSDTKSAGEFVVLAKKAAEREAAAAKQAADRCASGSSAPSSELEGKVRNHLAGSLPMVFGNVELYGPEPGGTGGDVLLGRGVLALIDPPASEKTAGRYELLFFSEDEGVRSVAKKFVIGPKMELKRQEIEDLEDCIDGDGPAASFGLPAQRGMPAHTINFDHLDTAETFARDYRVRQRLMEVAHKTAAGAHQADSLRGEIEGMKQRSLVMRIWRLLCFLMVLFIIGCGVHVAKLYAENKTRPVPELLLALLSDLQALSRVFRYHAGNATSILCEMAAGMVPAERVRMCAALPSEARIKQCIADVVG